MRTIRKKQAAANAGNRTIHCGGPTARSLKVLDLKNTKVEHWNSLGFEVISEGPQINTERIITMSTESLYQEKMQELQKQLNDVMQAINNNSKVVAFLNSPVGHYLEDHPFVSLSLLVFVVMSAIPVGLFLILLVGTAVSACIVVILLEGFVMSISGVALICVLIVLAILSFAISGLLSVCYAAVSSLTNFVYLSRASTKNEEHPTSTLQPGFGFSSGDSSVNNSKSD